MKRSAVGAAAALSMLAVGCGPQRPPVTAGPPRPCTIATTEGAAKPAKDRTFPALYWFALLLQKYGANGEVARPARDCGGWPVNLESDGCAGETPPARVATQPLGARDLVVSPLSDTRRLVWVMTDRLSDGEAEGPVAIAELQPSGVVVQSIGALRAYPENVTLRLATLSGGTVLIAEGELCERPGSCQRAMRLVPLIGQRFVPKPLVDDKGACLGNAFLPMRATGAAAGKGSAKYEMQVSVTFNPDAIAVREQLAITNAASEEAAAGSFVTRVQSERQISLHGETLLATAPSVLTRWKAQQRR